MDRLRTQGRSMTVRELHTDRTNHAGAAFRAKGLALGIPEC